MNLLLLLSALLSAITGVSGVGQRVPSAPAGQVAVVRSAVAINVARTVRTVVVQGIAVVFGAARLIASPLIRQFFAETPRYANRRRE